MVLLRNLRNLDEAGVGDEVVQQVSARLANPEQIVRPPRLPLPLL